MSVRVRARPCNPTPSRPDADGGVSPGLNRISADYADGADWKPETWNPALSETDPETSLRCFGPCPKPGPTHNTPKGERGLSVCCGIAAASLFLTSRAGASLPQPKSRLRAHHEVSAASDLTRSASSPGLRTARCSRTCSGPCCCPLHRRIHCRSDCQTQTESDCHTESDSDLRTQPHSRPRIDSAEITLALTPIAYLQFIRSVTPTVTPAVTVRVILRLKPGFIRGTVPGTVPGVTPGVNPRMAGTACGWPLRSGIPTVHLSATYGSADRDIGISERSGE